MYLVNTQNSLLLLICNVRHLWCPISLPRPSLSASKFFAQSFGASDAKPEFFAGKKKTSRLANIQEEDILSPLGKLKNQDKDNHSSFKAKIYLKGYSLWQSLSCIVVRGQEPKSTHVFCGPFLIWNFIETGADYRLLVEIVLAHS